MRHSFVILFFSALIAFAQPIPQLVTPPPTTNDPISVKLAWEPSPDDDIVAYRVLIGTNSGSYLSDHTVTNTTATVTNLSLGKTNFFVVLARNSIALESLPSNEVSAFVPTNRPASPAGLKLETQVTVVFETSMDGGKTWDIAGSTEPVILNNIGDMRLVRGRLETSAVPSL